MFGSCNLDGIYMSAANEVVLSSMVKQFHRMLAKSHWSRAGLHRKHYWAYNVWDYPLAESDDCWETPTKFGK